MKHLFVLLMLCTAKSLFAQEQINDSILIVHGKSKDTVGVFKKVEVEADYPGGAAAWRQFLMQNLKGDAIAAALPRRVKNFEETAIVQFIVCTDGSLCEIKVINKVHPAVKKEAERAIRESGTWNPALQSGRKVKAYRRQPITFRVTSA